jgi:signal transduction histidine kinase
VYLLKKRFGDNPELTKYLESIDDATDASTKLFEFSGAYERIGAEKRSQINVGASFNQAAALLPGISGIETVSECNGLTVIADSLLNQVFYNLLDNSLKHGQKITQIRLHFKKEREGTKILYEDNGVGIPEANKKKVFTEGFTTGNGSGLGLMLVRKIVETYGWSISEQGQPGKGVKFEIAIPNESIMGS